MYNAALTYHQLGDRYSMTEEWLKERMWYTYMSLHLWIHLTKTLHVYRNSVTHHGNACHNLFINSVYTIIELPFSYHSSNIVDYHSTNWQKLLNTSSFFETF